ncbi:MAG: hypothetical protein ACI9OU_001603 [Candidatus Promineifilaceae bacterium]|jgi:uncharacterized protein YbjT (DUF2867 family)
MVLAGFHPRDRSNPYDTWAGDSAAACAAASFILMTEVIPMITTPSKKILLTGATGYVGGRLLKHLEKSGYSVRCLARRPDYLLPRVGEGTEVVPGDVLDAASLEGHFVGIDTAYYLIHSMGGNGSYEEDDLRGAQNFADAARLGGVKRIIYLGGLGDSSECLSPHLKSRHDTGRVLASAGVPMIEFRASVIIGAGSLSFEMIRALVQKLPIMTTPKWVYVKSQPIAVSDLLEYLIVSLDLTISGHQIIEVGGADVVSYADLMREYAQQRGLKRFIIPVPFLTPYISSLWLGLVTPLFARIGKELIESLRHPTVVQDARAKDLFAIEPMGTTEAIRSALQEEERDYTVSHWADSLARSNTYRTWGGVRFGTRLVDSRHQRVALSPKAAFMPIQRIGGQTGWYYANTLWKIRGALDVLVGGVGMRRGRRHPHEIRVGDVIDCWRVAAYEPQKFLRLSAEMKLPGRAWLEFEIKENDEDVTIFQTAIFDPIGVGGILYWYSIYALHQIIFAGMLRSIVNCANAEDKNV